MPTYDLKCKDCGHEFPVFCSISSKDKQSCPKCGSSKLESLFKSVNSYGGSGSGGSSSFPSHSSGGG